MRRAALLVGGRARARRRRRRSLRRPYEPGVVRAPALSAPLLGVRARARRRARPRPGAPRRRHLPGVEVPTGRRVAVRRDRADAADARRPPAASRSARAATHSAPTICTTPRSTSATARGTSTTCSRSTGTRSSCSPRTTPARATSTAGRRAARASSSPRRARTSKRVEHLKTIYRARLALEPLLGGLVVEPSCSSSRRTRTRTRRSARRTSATSPIATCSGWAGPTSPAGTSRSASASVRTSWTTCAPRSTRGCTGKGRTACTWEVGTHATPGDLVDRLLDRGLVDDATPLAVGMVLTEPPAGPMPDVVVRKARHARRAPGGRPHRCRRVRDAGAAARPGRRRRRPAERRLSRIRRRRARSTCDGLVSASTA